MPENFTQPFPCQERNNFKEAVCIDAYRVYDSCADKNCLENLRVYFTESGQHVIDQATNARLHSVNVLNVNLDLSPVPFQKGFFSVDMSFFFEVNLEVFISQSTPPVRVCGVCPYQKKVVLYGSEGNVKIFTSESDSNVSSQTRNLPRAVCQVADPIGLSINVTDDLSLQSFELKSKIPDSIARRFGGEFVYRQTGRSVLATIGLFTIIQIERNVQMLIPSYDFCMPEKECVTSTDNPCELFSRIEFPTNEFFPPRVAEQDSSPCGCNKNQQTEF